MARVTPLTVGIIGLALVIGFVVGSWRAGPTLAVGVAHSVEDQVSIEAEGWTYAMPLDVSWVDANSAWHDGDRPSCVPPSTGPIHGVRFAYVEVSIEALSWRPVVWVDCR